jgi:colicin import membrane protein
LTVAERSEVEGYIAMLQQRLKDELDRTPDLDDGLVAEAEVHILADGRLTRARITRSSGDATFDSAVLRAIATVRMPERPKGLEEVQIVPFATRAKQ